MPNTDMTVGRLKKLLSEYPDKTPIVVSGDSEGNHFHVLSDMCNGGLNPVTIAQRGVFQDVEVYCDEDAPKNAIQALVIYPD